MKVCWKNTDIALISGANYELQHEVIDLVFFTFKGAYASQVI